MSPFQLMCTFKTVFWPAVRCADDRRGRDSSGVSAVVHEWVTLAAASKRLPDTTLPARLCPLFPELGYGDPFGHAMRHIGAYKERGGLRGRGVPRALQHLHLSRAVQPIFDPAYQTSYAPLTGAAWANVHNVAAAGDAEGMSLLMGTTSAWKCLDAVCPAGNVGFVACGCRFWCSDPQPPSVKTRKGTAVLRVLLDASKKLGCRDAWLNTPVFVILLGTSLTLLDFVLSSMNDASTVGMLLDAGATIRRHLHQGPHSFVRALAATRINHWEPVSVSADVKLSLAGIRFPAAVVYMFMRTKPAQVLSFLPTDVVGIVESFLVGASPWVGGTTHGAQRWEAALQVRRSMEDNPNT